MKSILSWIGGKSLLAPKLIPLIPPHHCYVEVFAGAAWMLFKKPESKVEIINDINSDLINLYRIAKHHLEEFIRYFKFVLTARDEYERFRKENPESLTDIQRAVRFYYLLKNTFASRLDFNSFTISSTRPPRINLLRIEEEFSAAHLRLNRVYIENMHFEKLIPRFDKPETFFYLDPPYFNCEDYYGKNIFERADFEKLRDILSAIQGKFMMSINDTPEIREIYKDFIIREVETRYTAAGANKSMRVQELLILNYDPDALTPPKMQNMAA